MSAADLAITKSGSVNLELTLHSVSFVLVFVSVFLLVVTDTVHTLYAAVESSYLTLWICFQVFTDLIAITRGSGCEAAQNLQPRVRFIQLTTMCLQNWMFKISLQCAGLRQTGTPSGGL